MSDQARIGEVTRILGALRGGDARAADALLPLVYDELRTLARSRMRKEPSGQTLQPTALVHEAYLRLVAGRDQTFENRGHFFGAAALAMRRILVERARQRRTAKHGGGWERVTLSDVIASTEQREVDLVVLDRALEALEAHDKRLSEVVMLRYFTGLTIEETARALALSPATIKRDWEYARAWLFEEMTRADREGKGGTGDAD
jgi:RNA polymerase sigma factor (TIGR02999 family)